MHKPKFLALVTTLGLTFVFTTITTTTFAKEGSSPSRVIYSQGVGRNIEGGDASMTFTGGRYGQVIAQYFSLTDNKEVKISRVTASGFFYDGPSTPTSFTISFYKNTNNSPGKVQSSQTITGNFTTPNTGNFSSADLDVRIKPVELKRGNWWISITANMPDQVTIWNWGQYLVSGGQPRVWITNPPIVTAWYEHPYADPNVPYGSTIFSLYGGSED